MRRNDSNSLLFGCAPSRGAVSIMVMAVLVAFLLVFPVSLFAQERTASSYEVLSVNASELIVRIAPAYKFDTVSTAGGPAVRVRFTGGTYVHSVGAPGEMVLSLPVLLPSSDAPEIDVISERYETVSGLSLAPVPMGERQDGMLREVYVRDEALYASAPALTNYEFIKSGTVRAAYCGSVNVYAVRYNGGSIRLAKEITLRLRFAQGATITDRKADVHEAEFFRPGFINGGLSEFYRSAASAVGALKQATIGYKQVPTATDEKWVAIKTTDEGIYRITAEQLSQYGISNADPATIAVYGYGAKMMPEAVDSLSGELHEVAIDVRTSGGAFQELRFYAPGVDDWRYSPENGSGKYFRIYHMKNPYSSSGHFLLKAGGAPAQRRIADKPDDVSQAPSLRTTVPAMALYENELKYEFPNYSREFVGETITRGSQLTITLPQLPGYTPESTYIRPATNSRAQQSHSFDISVNSTVLGTVFGRWVADLAKSPYYSMRNWDTEFQLSPSAGTPSTLSISVTSAEKQPQYWLNFVEIFYERLARLSDGQLSFFLANDASAYRLSMANEPSAELWDISDASHSVRLAASAGSTLTADLQGPGGAMRRFIAFRASDLRSPELSSTGAPVLRSGVCQNGATLLIIVPESYKGEGERLAEQRRRGGQATEPLTVDVVTVEEIYKEFGYGARDVAAIRDFLAYTLRHTTANRTTIPTFVAFFGKGHTDYQNRTTQLALGMPVYETAWFGSLTSYRKEHPEYVPDDAFFVRLMPRSNPKILDMASGRIAVRDGDEARDFVDKVIRYETSSDAGDWRARSAFIVDDRYYEDGYRRNDPLPHLSDTEGEIANTDERLTIEKIYGVTYPNTNSAAGGRLKPEMEAAIVDAFNGGSVLISFVGHGNPNVWTHEGILKVPATINKFSNLNRLTFLTTATCDFTAFDNYAELSGGVMLLIKPDGGIIGSLGTCRSVFGGENLVPVFYHTLFELACDEGQGSAPIGIAYVAGRLGGDSGNSEKFFILGDPSQRLLIPRQYVIVDSINGAAYDEKGKPFTLESLSKVTISGFISSRCDGGDFDANFNGTATLTLRDAPTHVEQTTTFTDTNQGPITDRWDVEGPILYRGTVTVTNGRFTAVFIVPKDIKFDTADAKLSMLAYSDNFRSALGAATNIQVFGTDTMHTVDNEGPKLTIFIGNRRFTSGDPVPVNSKIIVDIEDISGLNTSTSSIGHSFTGWVNDLTSNMLDLSESYVSRKDDYTAGTAERQAVLPLGKNVLHIRAFDALNNPSEATVEFIGRDADPYELYDVMLSANPVRGATTFTFLQPSSPQTPVDVTLAIHTADGRKVRTLEANGITTNEVRIPWDVRDDGGTLVSDGAYLYNIFVHNRLTGESTHTGGAFIVTKQ